jgi:hypothetical protein
LTCVVFVAGEGAAAARGGGAPGAVAAEHVVRLGGGKRQAQGEILSHFDLICDFDFDYDCDCDL